MVEWCTRFARRGLWAAALWPSLAVASPAQSVAPPKSASCTLSSQGALPQELSLRAAPGAEAYAKLTPQKPFPLRVVLPLGASPQSAYVEADLGALRLTGYLDVKELALYPARALTLGQVLITAPNAKLTYVRGERDKITVELLVGVSMALVRRDNPQRADAITEQDALPDDDFAMLQASAPCAAFALSPGVFDPWAQLPKPRRQVQLRAEVWHPLRASAEGPALLRLGADGDEAITGAVVLQQRGSMAQIALPSFDGVLFGWVSATRLAPGRPVFQFIVPDPMSALGGEQLSAPHRITGQRLSCQTDLEIFAKIGNDVARVGTLKAGHAAYFSGGARGHRVIALDGALLAPMGSAQLLVDAARSSAECK